MSDLKQTNDCTPHDKVPILEYTWSVARLVPHKFNVRRSNMQTDDNPTVSALLARIRTYSLNPLVAIIDDFRTPDELAALVASIPDSAMEPAGFFDTDGTTGGQKVNDQTRKALHKGFRDGKNATIDAMRRDIYPIWGWW